MESALETKLTELAPLDVRNLWQNALRCKVCHGRMRFFDVVDFNKHCSFEDPYAFGPSGIPVPYYRCRACGFLSTNFFENWTAQELARFVYNADYVKVDSEYVSVRPARLASAMSSWLHGCEAARILDYGSGTGAFSRLMRETGFSRIEDYDPFSSPGRPQGRFDIITCFEVIEHTLNPIAAVRDMKSFLADDGCIIFSQTLQPADIAEQGGNWWYLAPRNGHMSTFTAESLAVIADAAGLVFHLGTDPYAFAAPVMSPAVRHVVSTIGEPLAYLRLYAPRDGEGTAMWYPQENSANGASRWSKVAQLEWPMPVLRTTPCKLRVAVPLTGSISDDFAQGCLIRLGDRIVAARFDAGELRAEIAVNGRLPRTINVLTPEPISPRALRSVADDRLLGLAVEVKQ